MPVSNAGAIASSIGGSLAGNIFGGGLANAISGSEMSSGGTSDSTSAGGSYNSAQSVSGSNGWSQNESQNSGWSNTAGLQASANSALEAEKAHERQVQLLQMAQEFNSREAQKQRDWQANMANTVYTRSVKNMIEAGINPILAANLGLSGANVNSGASASVATPSSFMGQTFAEQNSASGGSSWGRSENSSYGKSSQSGGSWNSSESHSNEWSNSNSGLATGLRQMAEISNAAYNQITSSEALKWTMENFGDGRQWAKSKIQDIEDAVGEAVDSFTENFKPPAYSYMWNYNP